jgi:hypothetical protein
LPVVATSVDTNLVLIPVSVTAASEVANPDSAA